MYQTEGRVRVHVFHYTLKNGLYKSPFRKYVQNVLLNTNLILYPPGKSRKGFYTLKILNEFHNQQDANPN